jgi:hypothetical protein
VFQRKQSSLKTASGEKGGAQQKMRALRHTHHANVPHAHSKLIYLIQTTYFHLRSRRC